MNTKKNDCPEIDSAPEPANMHSTAEAEGMPKNSVGENNPQNHDEAELRNKKCPEAKRNTDANENRPNDVTTEEDDIEDLVPEPLDCTLEGKVDTNLFLQCLRTLIQNPNTWRVLKGLVVLALAVKFYNYYEAVEQYMPHMFNHK